MGFNKVFGGGRKEKIDKCELLKYLPTYSHSETQAAPMLPLLLDFKEKCVDTFLKKVDEETREQSSGN